MPFSLRWIAGLLACAILCAPLSLLVQGVQTRAAARGNARAMTGGDPHAGRRAFARYGCDGCHTISGLQGPGGGAGPALAGFAKNSLIAGRWSNTPEQLTAWIEHPQKLAPGTAMPELGVSEDDARDLGAYLYTLR